jgi:hypothetical protein
MKLYIHDHKTNHLVAKKQEIVRMNNSANKAARTAAVLPADVDGTMVTKGKLIADRAIQVVKMLRKNGITFKATNRCPPRDMSMFVEPLGLTKPKDAALGRKS